MHPDFPWGLGIKKGPQYQLACKRRLNEADLGMRPCKPKSSAITGLPPLIKLPYAQRWALTLQSFIVNCDVSIRVEHS